MGCDDVQQQAIRVWAVTLAGSIMCSSVMPPTMTTIALLGAAILLLTPAPAWAYIDPGAGSYFFQLLIAGGLAGVYTLRRYWHQVRMWFTRRKER